MEQQPQPVETVPSVKSGALTKGERTRERILDLVRRLL